MSSQTSGEFKHLAEGGSSVTNESSAGRADASLGPGVEHNSPDEWHQFRHGSAPMSQLVVGVDCAWIGTIRASGAKPAISRMILVLIASAN